MLLVCMKISHRLYAIMPSGDEIELGFLSPCSDGCVLGIREMKGVETPHLLIMKKGSVLSSHITYQTKPKKRRHLSEFDFRDVPNVFPESEIQKMIKQVPINRLSKNIFYISQNLIDWMGSVQNNFVEDRTSSKKIIHLLNFKKLAERIPELVGELKQSPSSYLGICKTKEILEDSSKFGLTNSGVIVLPIENQLYTLDFSFILKPQPKSSNILDKIYRATGFNQYIQEIEKKQMLDKLLFQRPSINE